MAGGAVRAVSTTMAGIVGRIGNAKGDSKHPATKMVAITGSIVLKNGPR